MSPKKIQKFEDLPLNLRQKFKLHEPEEWIKELAPSEINNVYINIPIGKLDKNKPLLIIVIGPSGAGKDTAIEPIISEQIGVQAITSTTRKRRIEENEPEWKYQWINESKSEDESQEDYENRIAKKYNLIEHDYHDNNVYGLSADALTKAASINKPVIIRTENKGLDTFIEKLAGEYNIVSIFITALNYRELFERIKTRKDILVRMEKAVDEVEDAKSKVNFVLLNPDLPSNPELAIANTQNNMRSLIELITSEI